MTTDLHAEVAGRLRRAGQRYTSKRRALVETVDLYPTVCELAGLPRLANFQLLEGKSLVPVLKNPWHKVKDAVFHVYPRSRRGDGAILGRAVRTARYRLVEWKK